LVGLGIAGAAACQEPEIPVPPLRFSLEPIPGQLVAGPGEAQVDSPAALQDPSHFVWGGSVVQAEDGRFHMFYAIFDAGPENPPFSDAWLLSSKIAHAVSDRPDRGFVFQRIILRGALHEGRPDAWDAQGVHNPHIQRFGGAYYLYYIGSRDPGPQPEGSPGANLRKRDRIQQVQKIGVIACSSIDDLASGRFTRPDTPLLEPRTRVKERDVIGPSPAGTQALPDNLIVVNPSVVFRPTDGKYLLYFKGNLYDPNWRGVHGVAIGDSPTGPFHARDEYVFDVRMPDGRLAKAEDPYVWHHPGSGLFYAVFKDFSGRVTRSDPGLALMTSRDGIQWDVAEDPLFSPLELVFEDGTVVKVAHLERPQLLIGPDGIPTAFYAACSLEPVGRKTDGSTFNVQMKVRVTSGRD
jgi:hypothetical protein